VLCADGHLGLQRADRRRHGLPRARQPGRPRLRHRLRQQGGVHGSAGRRHPRRRPRPHGPDLLADQLRDGAHQRGAGRPPGARRDPDRVLRSAARPPRPRRRAARNGRRGQPLRRPARLARAARRAGLLGGPQGRDAGATRPARLRRLDHGRAQRDPRGRRLAPQRRGPVLDGPRRRAGDEPHRGSRPAAQALRGAGSSCAAAPPTRRPAPTSASTRSSPRTPAPSGCCTPSRRSASRWPAPRRSTPTRTDPSAARGHDRPDELLALRRLVHGVPGARQRSSELPPERPVARLTRRSPSTAERRSLRKRSSARARRPERGPR
jgi:hypothetical protein